MDKDVPSIRVWRQGAGSGELNAAELHGAALSMLIARRALRGTLPAALIHDPALEMLLALYLAQPAPVAAEALVTETTVSRNVGLHWIEALRSEGLITRMQGDVALSDDGLAAVEGMIEAVILSQRTLLGWGDQ